MFVDDEDKVKVAVVSFQVLPNAMEEEIARFEKRIQEMPPISALWNLKTILKLFFLLSMG